MLRILSFYLWLLLHSDYHHVRFLSPCFIFVFLGELSNPHYKSLHVLPFTYIFFDGSLRLGVISPYVFLILDVILLSTGSCLVSAAILSKDKTSVSTQCKNVFSNSFSVLSFDNLYAHLSILDVGTLGYSFLGLNINSNGIWSLLKIIFLSIKNCRGLAVVHTMVKASFYMFE